jgi:hypothetical protein
VASTQTDCPATTPSAVPRPDLRPPTSVFQRPGYWSVGQPHRIALRSALYRLEGKHPRPRDRPRQSYGVRAGATPVHEILTSDPFAA